jgi:uncharacterized coiled-coil DUF342 family protein
MTPQQTSHPRECLCSMYDPMTTDTARMFMEQRDAAVAEVKRLRAVHQDVRRILENIRDEARDTRDTESGHRFIEGQAQRGIAALSRNRERQ